MQVQSNVKFEPSWQHKINNPKCKSKRKVLIGGATWKVEAQKPDTAKSESEPNEVIDFAEAQKPRKPRWPKPTILEPVKIVFDTTTVVLPMSAIDVNGAIMLGASTLAVTNDGRIVINGMVTSGLECQITNVKCQDEIGLVNYKGKAPSDELVFVLVNALFDMMDATEMSLASNRFASYPQSMPETCMLVTNGEVIHLDRSGDLATCESSATVIIHEVNPGKYEQYDLETGKWQVVEIKLVTILVVAADDEVMAA